MENSSWPGTRHVGIKVDDLVWGERLAGCRHGIGQRERGYPSGTGDVGQVKHAGRVGQGIVEVADDKRILVPRLVGTPWGRHSMVISQPRRVTRVKSGTASHPTLNMKARKFATPFSSHAVAVNLVAEICGSHVRCLRKGHPRVEILQFSREDFHEPRHEGEHVGPLALVQGTGGAAAVTFLARPGKRLLLQWHTFTFPVVRGHPVATGSFRVGLPVGRVFFSSFS